MAVEIRHDILIDDDELKFSFSRSGGPGGQNVNKLNTKVILSFDVKGSAGLSDWQKQRIISRLSNRIDKEGVLKVACQEHRSQLSNRLTAIERFVGIVQRALEKRPIRKKSGIPYAVKKKRMEAKKKRGVLKRLRNKGISMDN